MKDDVFAVYKEDAIGIVKESLGFMLRAELGLAYCMDQKKIDDRLQFLAEQVIDQLENNRVDEEDLKEYLE